MAPCRALKKTHLFWVSRSGGLAKGRWNPYLQLDLPADTRVERPDLLAARSGKESGEQNLASTNNKEYFYFYF